MPALDRLRDDLYLVAVAAAAGEFCWSSTPGGREPFLRLGSSEKPLERRDHDGCDHDAGRDQALGQAGLGGLRPSP